MLSFNGREIDALKRTFKLAITFILIDCDVTVSVRNSVGCNGEEDPVKQRSELSLLRFPCTIYLEI